MRIISAEWNRYKPYNPELIWILKPNYELTDKLNCSWIQTRELILLPMRYYVVLVFYMAQCYLNKGFKTQLGNR